MVELPKGLQHFIARDLNYLIGGGCVVTSYVHLFGLLGNEELPVVLYLLAAGIAYMVGYALQDLFSIFHFVTTSRVYNPRRVLKWCYCRFTNEKWKDLTSVDWSKANIAIKSIKKTEQERADYERIVSLMMIGTTMSPCCLLSGIFLCLRYWFKNGNDFDLSTALGTFVLCIVFLILAWIKASQVTQADADTILQYEEFIKRGTDDKTVDP